MENWNLKAYRFELKNHEVTVDAVKQVRKLQEQNEYITIRTDLLLRLLQNQPEIAQSIKADDDLITFTEAAKMTGLSRQFFYRLGYAGKIKTYQKGKKWCVSKSSLIEYIENRQYQRKEIKCQI